MPLLSQRGDHHPELTFSPGGQPPRIASVAQQDQTEPDARVAAAAAHWSYRFISNGTDYGDFTATLSRITRWDDWCREW